MKINHMSTCTTQEFKFKNKNLNFALARINGRYPEVGQALNLKCDMVYYCLAGQGTVSLTGRKKKIKPGQALLVGKNKKYYVIQVGVFNSLSEAQKLREKLEREEGEVYRIVIQ